MGVHTSPVTVVAVLVAAVSLAPHAVHATAIITDCGKGEHAAVAWDEFALHPAQPVRGEPFLFQANGTASAAVNSGGIVLDVSLNGTELWQDKQPNGTCGATTIDLPMGLGKIVISALDCPVKPGAAVTFNTTITLPTIAPAGTYEAKLTGQQYAGDVAFCIAATVSM